MYSKKKHNINYTKPEEPAFLKRFKEQAGYVEGPSVDTKREDLPSMMPEDEEDRDDEQPTVVIMTDGDLTAEEANLYAKAKKEVDAVEKADLSQRVIFKRKQKPEEDNTQETSATKDEKDSKTSKKSEKSKTKKSKPTKVVLSFNDEEDEG